MALNPPTSNFLFSSTGNLFILCMIILLGNPGNPLKMLAHEILRSYNLNLKKKINHLISIKSEGKASLSPPPLSLADITFCSFKQKLVE